MGLASAAETAPLTTMAMAMFFGTITFTTIAFATRSYIIGDFRALKMASSPKSSPLNLGSFESIYTFLHHMTVFGFILFYAYICEYHPPYPHADKSYDRDMFFFLTAMLFLVSAFTMKKHEKPAAPAAAAIEQDKAKCSPTKALLSADESMLTSSKDDDGATVSQNNAFCALNKKFGDASTCVVEAQNDATEVLNRDQTEEWKGWMQFMFLLYHYYHAEEVYNSIRIMITCYVWMTGFGNFSFFYLKADYGFVRFIQMMWRLNFLVIFLCLTQGTTYILYYICLLHTYFFLMVYVVMKLGSKTHNINYTKWAIRQKLFALALLIFCVWDIDIGLFKLLHWPFLSTKPMLGATLGKMWEWYFRSSLDHWSTFLGMVFALNFPITSLFFRKIESKPVIVQVFAKGSVGVVLFSIFCWWVANPYSQDKFNYNQTNCYWGFIPLITYIYFRNITRYLRARSLNLLHQIGKTTLETYLMQHHIWLTSDAKSLLTLIPGYPKMNFLLVTCIYYVCSRRLYTLTLFLRGMMLPNNTKQCIHNLCMLFVVMFSYVILALFLQFCNALDLTTIGFFSIFLGIISYQIILERTGASFFTINTMFNNSNNDKNKTATTTVVSEIDRRKVNFFTTSLLGAVTILFMGVLWHVMAKTGATKIIPLHESCANYANHGQWIPIDSCNNEENRGTSYRTYGVSRLATTCNGEKSNPAAYAWGWNITNSFMLNQCRFKHRDAKSLGKTLKNRNLLFIGDSETRNVYHAFTRQMGKSTNGILYNSSTTKHANVETVIGSTKLKFIWAPFTQDQKEELGNIMAHNLNEKASTSEAEAKGHENSVYDLIFMGGGPWDRLQKYKTDQEKKLLDAEIMALRKRINAVQNLGYPVTWFIPTSISTDALLSDEKKIMINEDAMEEVRNLYSDRGITTTASFVLDGPAFTHGRIFDSYDGLYYPESVYNAGAQIYANAIDWLLKEKPVAKRVKITPVKQPGEMAHPLFGIMMLCLVFVGLFCFDGFMGTLYVASIFAGPDVKPSSLFDEAYKSLHTRAKLPPIDEKMTISVLVDDAKKAVKVVTEKGLLKGMMDNKRKESDTDVNDSLKQKEMSSLLDDLEDPLDNKDLVDKKG